MLTDEEIEAIRQRIKNIPGAPQIYLDRRLLITEVDRLRELEESWQGLDFPAWCKKLGTLEAENDCLKKLDGLAREWLYNFDYLSDEDEARAREAYRKAAEE